MSQNSKGIGFIFLGSRIAVVIFRFVVVIISSKRPNTVSESTRVQVQIPSSMSFLVLTEFRGRERWVPLSLLSVCQSELTEFIVELTSPKRRPTPSQDAVTLQVDIGNGRGILFRKSTVSEEGTHWVLGQTVVNLFLANYQRKTKGQQLKGKIVLALFSNFLALFHICSRTFSVFSS